MQAAEPMPSPSERRTEPRLAIKTPAKIFSGSSEVPCYTRDLSKGGFFLECMSCLNCGPEIELILLVPAELADGEGKWMRCVASVKRIETLPTKATGIAGSFLKMEDYSEDLD